MNARPFIKFAGGKTSSLPFLLQFIPEKIGTYIEPMVGGGALFWELANQKRFKKAIINDLNEELINTYRVIQEQVGVRDLIAYLKKMKNTEKDFYRWREKTLSDPVQRAARFIYLNKTDFNGLYRVNKKGKFNVPFGHYKNPTICDEENLLACHRALQGVVIKCVEYIGMPMIKKGDLMYIDPPYVPVSKTANFVSYNSSGFDHEELSSWSYLELTKGTVLLSNADVPVARSLYKGLEIYKNQVRRNVNSVGTKRGHVGEILVVINGKKKASKKKAA